jgi:hypothetical protein
MWQELASRLGGGVRHSGHVGRDSIRLPTQLDRSAWINPPDAAGRRLPRRTERRRRMTQAPCLRAMSRLTHFQPRSGAIGGAKASLPSCAYRARRRSSFGMEDRTTTPPSYDAAAQDNDPLAGVRSAREAALALGVSERTIRRAIQRGELIATKRAGIFHITPAALEAYRQHEAERRSLSGAAASAGGAAAPDNDESFAAATDSGHLSDDAVVVLRDLLAEERARSDRLLEAATLWQARAMQLEERVKALEAGPLVAPDAAVAANEGPGEAMPAAMTDDATRADASRWGRFWRALTGRA